MHATIILLLHKLSSKSVFERKKAIKEITQYLTQPGGHLVRLSLYYMSEHDPSHTVRTLAKRAFYMAGTEPSNQDGTWERTRLFSH